MALTSRKSLAAFTVAAALLAAGCGSSSAKGGSGSTAAPSGGATTVAAASTKKGGTLTLGMLAGIKTFSVAESEFGNRVLFYQAPYDGLVHMEPDGKLTPWLATSWSYNADLTVLTMKLKDGVKFTDGTPFNADAAAKNLTRFKGGKSPDATNLSLMTEAKAVDASTLQVTLSGPDPAFLNYMSRNAGLMESPAAFDKPEEATNAVGTGPYLVDTAKTVADSVYTFKANPDYWNKSAVKYDGLVLKIISDPAAMVNAIKAGEVNAANLVNNDVLADVKGAGFSILANELDWVGLTLVDRDGKMGSPFKDVKVRQAMNFAFDREGMLKGYGAGFGTVTTQVFRKGSDGYDPALDSFYKYDPAKAKALLAEAGFPNGFDIEMAKVAVLGEAVYALIADQLAAVGVKVKWVDTAIGDYFKDILTPKYPAFFMFLEQNGNDWQAINFLMAKSSVWNPSKYSDATTDDLIAKIQKATDADRPALVKALGKYITEQAWFVPLYRKQGSFAADAKTDVKLQSGNAVPYLSNFSPKG
jgi:peptide/nickel transport system substrate-binding protein